MIDQNTFSEVIPAYYKRIDIHFDDYEKLIEASTNVASQVSKSRGAKAKQNLTKKRAIQISDDEEETPPAKKRPTRLEFSSPPATLTPPYDVTARPSTAGLTVTARPITAGLTPTSGLPGFAAPRTISVRPSTTIRTPAHGLLNFLRRENEDPSPGTPADDAVENETDDENLTDDESARF